MSYPPPVVGRPVVSAPVTAPPWPPHAPEAPPSHPVRRRLYLLLIIPPFGLTTWAVFLYTGIRARRGSWLAWSAIYLAALVAFVVLGQDKNGSTGLAVASGLGLATWIGGGIHALATSGSAVRRIYGPRNPH